jgi:hypothetical protein
VTSGAVASGMSELGVKPNPNDIVFKQVCAAVGQSILMTQYRDFFKEHGLKVAQILLTKEDLSEDIKSYPPYIINRCLSGHIDCIMFANEMNMNHHLSKDLQYSFYLNSLRKKKRFSPWLRKENIKDLECVKHTMVIVMKRHPKL